MRGLFFFGIALPVAITAVALFVLAPIEALLVALSGGSSSVCLMGYARAAKRSRLSALAATFEIGAEAGRRHP